MSCPTCRVVFAKNPFLVLKTLCMCFFKPYPWGRFLQCWGTYFSIWVGWRWNPPTLSRLAPFPTRWSFICLHKQLMICKGKSFCSPGCSLNTVTLNTSIFEQRNSADDLNPQKWYIYTYIESIQTHCCFLLLGVSTLGGFYLNNETLHLWFSNPSATCFCIIIICQFLVMCPFVTFMTNFKICRMVRF